jgi:septum formation protein
VTASTVPVVLASASEVRARLLRSAGVAFICDPANVDEEAIKAAQKVRGSPPEQAAVVLAEAKASEVARRHPGSLVIGGDQLLVWGAIWLDKPLTRAEARATLETLRGQTHRLVSGLVVVRNGTVQWRHVEAATLMMRSYSDAFVDWYLDEAEDEALQVVGACRLEGVGAQALRQIEGDYFTVLGLPLLPLLAFLRNQGVLLA